MDTTFLYIEGHECEGMANGNHNIAISQRLHEGKKSWFWEQDLGDKVIANGIKFCPYCGEELPK
jgi:hypothetical protein